MPNIGRFDKTYGDSATGLPHNGAKVTIYREGASANGASSGTSPLTVAVHRPGKIVTGDTVFLNDVTGTTFNVDSFTPTTVVLSGFAGTLSISDLDRLISSNNLPTLFEDDQSAGTKANPLTTDSNGRAHCWIGEGPYEEILSGTGVTTTLVQGVQQISFQDTINVKGFGARGDGTTDDAAAIQAAIDNAALNPTRVGFIFFPIGVYLIGTTLELKTGARLVGVGPTAGAANGSVIKLA